MKPVLFNHTLLTSPLSSLQLFLAPWWSTSFARTRQRRAKGLDAVQKKAPSRGECDRLVNGTTFSASLQPGLTWGRTREKEKPTRETKTLSWFSPAWSCCSAVIGSSGSRTYSCCSFPLRCFFSLKSWVFSKNVLFLN